MKNISNFFVIQCHHGIGSAPNCDSNGNRKMATDGGVHTVAVMANKKRLLPSQCEQGLRITGNEEKQQEKGEISTIKGGRCPIFHVFLPCKVVQLYLNIH